MLGWVDVKKTFMYVVCVGSMKKHIVELRSYEVGRHLNRDM
jgi:hypothetical protein